MGRAATAGIVFLGLGLSACGQAGAPIRATAPELVIQDQPLGWSLSFSPDGRYFVTTSAERSERTLLWETATGRLVRAFPVVPRQWGLGGPYAGVERAGGGTSAAFSPDGRYVAAVDVSTSDWIRRSWSDPQHLAPAVWEVSTGKPVTDTLWRFQGASLRQPGLPWSASELIAWGAVRDADAARRLADYAGPVHVMTPDGRLGVTVEGDRPAYRIVLRELPSNRVLGGFASMSPYLMGIALAPDGRWAALARGDDGTEAWDLRTFTRIARLATNATALAVAPDGRYLAAGGGSGLQLFRTSDWTSVSSRTGGLVGPFTLAFTPDSRRLAVLGDSLWLLDVPSGRRVYAIPRAMLEPLTRWTLRDSVLATARGGVPLTGPEGLNSIQLWPLRAGAPRTLARGIQLVNALALSPDGSLLAAALRQEATVSHITRGFVGGVLVLHTADGRALIRPEDEYSDAADQVAFTPDGRSLLAVQYAAIVHDRGCPYVQCGEDERQDNDAWLLRLDLATGAGRRLVRLGSAGPDGDADYVLSPRADWVLAGTRASARVLDASTLRRVPGSPPTGLARSAPFTENPCAGDEVQPAGFLATSRDGALLAVGNGQELTVVRPASGAIVARLDSAGAAHAAAFTPDGAALALVDCALRPPRGNMDLLELPAGKVRPLVRVDEPINGVLFLSGDRMVVRTEGRIRLYDARGTLLAWLLHAADDSWLVTTPTGLWDGSARGRPLAVWRQGMTLVAPSELPPEFHVPGLLGRLLRGEALPRPAWPAALR